jgi:hypothetical protein
MQPAATACGGWFLHKKRTALKAAQQIYHIIAVQEMSTIIFTSKTILHTAQTNGAFFG